MASTSQSTADLEDHIVRERTKQIILQSMSFKTSLKVNCIMAVEVDNEPTRCVILNEVFSSADRARFVAQAPIPFLSLDPTTYATSEANGFFPKVNHCSTPSTKSYEYAATHHRNSEHAKTMRKDRPFSSTPSKRKAGKPCRIPPSNLKDDCNGVLDLSRTELTPPLDDAGESLSSEALRKFLSGQQKNYEDNLSNPQDILSNFPLSLANSFKENNFANVFPEDIKMESATIGYGDQNSDAHLNSTMPIFPPVKVSYQSISNGGAVVKPKKRVTSTLGGVISKRSGSSKVFACNQCKEQFNSLTSLCKHTFSVHRAFRCTFCGANFTQRSNLQRHSLKHVGFKPFICNVCSKAYYRKDHLVRHIEVTHPEVEPKASITVKLTSSECLEYLDKMQKDEGSGTPIVKGSPAQSDNGLDPLQNSATNILESDSTTNISGTDVISEPPTNVSVNNELLENQIDDDEMLGEDLNGEHIEIVQPEDVDFIQPEFDDNENEEALSNNEESFNYDDSLVLKIKEENSITT